MQTNRLGTEVLFVGGNNDVDIGANAIIVRNRDITGRPVNILIDSGSKLTQTDPIYEGISPDLRDLIMKTDAILLTHCHNDHFGGLNTLEILGYRLPPIYGSLCTLNAYKMHRRNLGLSEESAPEFRAIRAGEPVRIGGSVEVEGFDVSHSALGAMGFHVLTEVDGKENVGMIFTGDFNLRDMQAKYTDGRACGFNEAAYQDLIARKKTTHIFMDSTSTTTSDAYIFDKEVCIESWVKLFETMEKEQQEQLFTTDIGGSGEHVIKKAEALRRYNQRYNAQKTMYVASFNLSQTMKAARNAGLDVYPDVIFYGSPHEFLQRVAPKDRVIDLSGAFADGSGEIPPSKQAGKSGVVRLSEQEKGDGENLTGHPFFTITSKDVFAQAQRDVGINSKGMRQINNRFSAMGVKVYQVKTYLESSLGNYPMMRLQSSGHCGNSETRQFLNYHPKDTQIIPIHGDLNQLETAANIAKEEGYKASVFENADTIRVATRQVEFLNDSDIDKASYLAFRQESTQGNCERTIFVDEVNVYQDAENSDKEHIVFVNDLGVHKQLYVKGKWMSVDKINEQKEEKAAKRRDAYDFEEDNISRKPNRRRNKGKIQKKFHNER